MYVVAVVVLAGSVEDESRALAKDLGATPYDTALTLRGGFPAIVLRTAERGAALDLLGKLRARGHDAVACDASAVVSSDAMTEVRALRFDEDAFVTGSERLAYDDVFALVRATHHTRIQSTEVSRERKLSVGRAVLSGGVVMSKTVTHESRTAADDREPVLYLFARGSGRAPWLLRASRARYEELGPDKRPSLLENFTTTVRLLRERAPRAFYDERLLAVKAVQEKLSSDVRGREQTSTSAGVVDLLAHLVALSLARRARGGAA